MASELMQAVKLGLFANPIFGDGDYPDLIKQAGASIAATFNIPSPILEFTADEKVLQKGKPVVMPFC